MNLSIRQFSFAQRSLVSALLLFVSSAALAENFVVPDGLGGYKVYQQFGTGQDWNTANTGATGATNPVFGGLGGNLIRIDSSAENIFAQQIALGGNPWIGANDAAVEGDWNWTSGSPSPTFFWQGPAGGSAQNGLYTNWNGGEPNESFPGEDFAQINSGSGGWNDLGASASESSLREFTAVGSLINATTVAGQPVLLNAGNGKYYQRTTTTQSWIDSKAIAESRQLQGAQGYLVQINDAAENAFVAGLGGDWIGLTDDAMFGGGPDLNFGNAVWSSAYNSSFVPGTTTLASTGYTNWNGGEPNGNNGENYGQMNSNGTWNDLANSGPLAANIEYNVSVARNFTARDIKSTGTISGGAAGIDQAISMANNLVAGASETTGSYAAINFLDPDGGAAGGIAGGNVPFPNNSPADDQNFIVRARGAIYVPTAGNYRFQFNNDDSTQLVVGDNVFQDNSCCSNQTSPAFALSAGVHNVTAVFTEIGGGAGFEILGETSPGSGVYALLGDTVNGGLASAARKELYFRASPGITVRDVKSTGTVNSIGDAISLLGGSGIASETTTSGYQSINLIDPQNPGTQRFGLNSAYPNGSGGDDDDFAVDITATLYVPSGSAGTWTFGLSYDDGFRLLIDNVNILEVPIATAGEGFVNTPLSAGDHTFRLIQFERGGGASIELYYAEGTHTSFNSSFELLSVPEPTGLGLASIGLVALLAQRRRRK